MEVFGGQGNNVPIVKCFRIGQIGKNGHRAVLCQFLRFHDAQLLLNNRKQLPQHVYAREDYPPEIESRRRMLRPIFNRAKNMEKYKGKCQLSIDKLVINGRTFTVEPVSNLDRLPPELNPRKTAERENDEVLAFFTQFSPFSNFHPASFRKNGTTYTCNEQFIQASKAEMFDDEYAHSKIMNTKCPFEMKTAGSRVRRYDEKTWRNAAEKVAYDGCMAKFSQNGRLMDILLATNQKQLVEASIDSFWGAGITLNNPNVLDNHLWTGNNLLGKVLMAVRQELKSV